MPKNMDWFTMMRERVLTREIVEALREVDRVEAFPWSSLVGRIIQ
jgi:hypothetical protein